MKTKTKVIISVVSVLLAIAIILTAILVPLAVSTKKPVINSGESIRYIDASSLANTTYEEKAKQLLNQFDDYSAKIDNSGNMSFEGTAEVDISQIQKLNFVTSYDKKIDKKLKVTINQETCDFNIIVSYYQDNILLSRDTIVTQPYYIEELDDYFIDVKDERISIKETLISESVNNCFAAEAVIGTVVLGSLVVLAVYTLAPQMQQVVTGITEVVTRIFTSFWNWLKGLFTTQTVTKPVTTTVKVYRIVVNGQTYTLKKVESAEDNRLKLPDVYYIALFNGEPSIADKNVYLSCQSISKAEAIAILTSVIDIPIEEGGTIKYRMHTYTFLEILAYTIAAEAAVRLAYTIEEVYTDNCHAIYDNKPKQGVFFPHCHIGRNKNKLPSHSFFGLPTINL